jgi:hypothetical protein
MTADADREAGRRVALVLTKSEEAEATIESLLGRPGVEVVDHETYWRVSALGEIVVDLEEIGERLGRPIGLGEWLVAMSSYVGRVVTEPNRFRVTSDLPQLTMSPRNKRGSCSE